MEFVGWMYDLAREQSPSEQFLEEVLSRSRRAGYNAVGLYMEHRFAYSSAPWAAGPGCLTPEVVRRLTERFCPQGLRVIPFLNTLGHMEGFIRAEGGQWLAEGRSSGSQQTCPSRPECAEFARGLIADVLDAFDDEWVHLGGDETRQLGQCERCAARVEQIGKAGLYAEYFAPLCRWVLGRGRRPCLWGDMLIQYPDALDALPRETVIFDWHYDTRPADTTRMFREHGFDVVCCPSVHTYDAGWCFLDTSRQNIDAHAEDARRLDALGVCVTTWEYSLFTQYLSTLPVIYSAGRRLAGGEDWKAALAAEGGKDYAQAAEILGNHIPAAARFLQPGTWRQLRDRLVIRQNPFYLWQDWRAEACGPAGDEILRLCDEARAPLPAGSPLLPPIELHGVAVQWVRLVERAYGHYADGDLAACASELEGGHALFDRLRPGLEQAARAGGSTADPVRLELLADKLKRVCRRIQALPTGTAHRPAFETLIHDAYVPGDQAAWRAGCELA
ncbi:MAG TPA: family 20 glycosylhydrolase [Phycisphaerae bacterium]|nr:family 20 glycosylhydrolase [Phycisphaerae bacterium]